MIFILLHFLRHVCESSPQIVDKLRKPVFGLFQTLHATHPSPQVNCYHTQSIKTLSEFFHLNCKFCICHRMRKKQNKGSTNLTRVARHRALHWVCFHIVAAKFPWLFTMIEYL